MLLARRIESVFFWGRTSRARRFAALLRLRSILQDDILIGGKAGVGPDPSEPGPDPRRPK
jgi:hypothetical protein